MGALENLFTSIRQQVDAAIAQQQTAEAAATTSAAATQTATVDESGERTAYRVYTPTTGPIIDNSNAITTALTTTPETTSVAATTASDTVTLLGYTVPRNYLYIGGAAAALLLILLVRR